MSVPLFQVDAFTREPFAGNPAAVVLLEAPAPESWMAPIAAEMNLSETAFVVPQSDGVFGLRWFTPTIEVDLCGHATLATAHVLHETGRWDGTAPVQFETRSGRLSALRKSDRIELNFPAAKLEPTAAPAHLLSALGTQAIDLQTDGTDLLIVLERAQGVRQLAPDLAVVRQWPYRGITVTARAPKTEDADFVSRFFAPASGIDEDPVTGSAHCALAPYWAPRLGKTEMVGVQWSARGGCVHVRLEGDRAFLGGQAVTVFSGLLRDDPTT